MSPAGRIKASRREIRLTAWLLNRLLRNLEESLRDIEKTASLPGDDAIIDGLYLVAVQHSQKIFRELGRIREAVQEARNKTIGEIENAKRDKIK